MLKASLAVGLIAAGVRVLFTAHDEPERIFMGLTFVGCGIVSAVAAVWDSVGGW